MTKIDNLHLSLKISAKYGKKVATVVHWGIPSQHLTNGCQTSQRSSTSNHFSPLGYMSQLWLQVVREYFIGKIAVPTVITRVLHHYIITVNYWLSQWLFFEQKDHNVHYTNYKFWPLSGVLKNNFNVEYFKIH